MLRLKLCVLTVAFILVIGLLLTPRAVRSDSGVVRLTKTVEPAVNLNPSLSDDGRLVVFESSADFVAGGLKDAFHAIRVNVSGDPPEFIDFAASRIVSPSLSSDGSSVVFASREDLVGENFDRNSEIFLRSSSGLRQITHTSLPSANSQPSLTADGRLIAFAANRDLLLFDVNTNQLTVLSDGENASSPKLSGNGFWLYYQRGPELVLLDLKTGNKQIVATDVPKLSLGAGRAVSHDGMRLVYSAEIVENQSQVFLFDARNETTRQLTQLGSRVTDVDLRPTISSDGKRVAFATRRRVVNASDGSVELYLYDVPSGQTQQITNAPARATGEVVLDLGESSDSSTSADGVVVNGRRRNLGVAGQFNLPGGAGEIHRVSGDLVRAVLARGLDIHGVGAGLHQPALVVLAVPYERVAAGGARGARDRADNRCSFGKPPQPIAAIPRAQVGQPLRVAAFVPDGQRADRKAILVFDPDRDIGTLAAAAGLRYFQ
jgi:Tol biopolymer transport system component